MSLAETPLSPSTLGTTLELLDQIVQQLIGTSLLITTRDSMADTERAVGWPNVDGWSSFTDIMELSFYEEDGQHKNTTSIFIIFDEASHAFVAELPGRKRNLTLEQAKSGLRRVPDHEIYPRAPADMTVFVRSPEQANNAHIKRPKLEAHSWFRDSTELADRLLVEAQMLELIRLHPHPNIVQYKGCVVREGLIVGLALERHDQTLMSVVTGADGRVSRSPDRASPDRAPPDSAKIEQWLHDIESAVDHLHRLGFAHNDINPRNIMQDGSGSMVLIDLGSCTRLGERLVEGGTPGYNEGFTRVSSKETDAIGQQQVEKWLRNSC